MALKSPIPLLCRLGLGWHQDHMHGPWLVLLTLQMLIRQRLILTLPREVIWWATTWMPRKSSMGSTSQCQQLFWFEIFGMYKFICRYLKHKKWHIIPFSIDAQKEIKSHWCVSPSRPHMKLVSHDFQSTKWHLYIIIIITQNNHGNQGTSHGPSHEMMGPMRGLDESLNWKQTWWIPTTWLINNKE